ncbi:hypothetical protein QT633_22500, partial [Xanthomonas citri pv. citri]
MRGNRLHRLARVTAALSVGAAALAAMDAYASDTGATAGSAPAAAQATPPAPATSAAPVPPSAAEGAQPTGAAVPAKAYTPTPQQVRYGNAIAFRTLI